MNLTSGYPFWSIKNGLLHTFPRLEGKASCDVAVIGGGITGAIIADALQTQGFDVLVVERREVGWGSTSASTALLQYEIDTPLAELSELRGEANAVMAYRACAGAIGSLRELARSVRDVDFADCESLYFASRDRDLEDLETELEMRTHYGLPVRWVDAGELREDYGLVAPGAILSSLGASVDPYRFALRLLARIEARGGRVFDRTVVDKVEPGPRDVTLRVEGDVTVRAKHVVVAAGYETQRWIPERVAKNRSSYACISDPIAPERLGRLSSTMVWETARPYLYLRATEEGRIIAGGEDDAIDNAAKRDARVLKRAKKLCERVEERFPNLDMRPRFSWAGTFAETDDGLPYFGPHEAHGPRVLFAMAYGGNGITYSMIGAGLVTAALRRERHELAELFSFSRV